MGNQNWLGLPHQLPTLGRGPFFSFLFFFCFFGHFGSLWTSTIINLEDYCYVAVTLIGFCYQGIGFVLFVFALVAANVDTDNAES